MSVRPLQPQSLLRAALLASSALAASAAVAQDQSEVTDLGQIVLSATGRAQSLEEVQASVEVITAEEIEAGGARNTFELLKDAVGVDAATSGTRTLIRMRGQNEYSTLLLIDGNPRPGNYGGMNFGNIPVGDIEQIEIVRGPMSALYGADALGGVINVITKRPGENPGTSLSTTLGLHPGSGARGALKFNLAHEFGNDTLGHRISLGADGSQAGKLPTNTTVAQDFADEREYSLSYAGSWAPSETDELNWRFEIIRQDDESVSLTRPRAPAQRIEYTGIEKETRKSVDLSYKTALGQGDLTASAYYGDADGYANYSYSAYSAGIESTRHKQSRVQLRYDIETGAHRLSMAFGAQNDKVDISQNTTKTSEQQYFALAQDEWQLADNVMLTAGLRLDDHEVFGSSLSPRLTLGSLSDGLTWRVSAGEAFRAPTALERYARIPRGDLIVGNENLEPEESRSFEAAIGWRDDTHAIELVAHDSKVKNLITSVPYTADGITEYVYENTSRARIRGLELTGSWQLSDAWDVGGSLEYLDAKDSDTQQRLEDRAKNAFSLYATYSQSNWSVTGSVNGWSDYYTADVIRDGAVTAPADWSSLVQTNLSGSYDLSEQTAIYAGVNNLFDHDTPANYNNGYANDAGRYVYVTVNHKF